MLEFSFNKKKIVEQGTEKEEGQRMRGDKNFLIFNLEDSEPSNLKEM